MGCQKTLSTNFFNWVSTSNFKFRYYIFLSPAGSTQEQLVQLTIFNNDHWDHLWTKKHEKSCYDWCEGLDGSWVLSR